MSSAKSLKLYFNQLLHLIFPGKKDDSLRASLARGAVGSFILKASSTGLTLLISILLARILGAEEFGYYAYALTIINLLTVPTTLGLPNLVVRHTAAYKAKSLWGFIRGLLFRANQAVLLVSTLLAIGSFIVVQFVGAYIPSLSLPVFYTALLLLPLLGLNALREAALKGLNHVVLGQMPEHIIRHTLFLVFTLALAFVFGPQELDSGTAMWLQVAATLIAFVIGFLLLFKKLPKEAKTAHSEYETKSWIKSAIPLLVVGGMQVINRRTDILMLGIFTSSDAVGIYQVVTRGAELILFSLFAVNMTVAPVISRLYVNNEMQRLQRIVTVSSAAILVFSLPIALILIIFGSWILGNIFGPEFAIGAAAMAILSLAHLINAGMGSVSYLLNMTGYEKDSAKSVTAAVIINIILNIVLIPIFGMEGAAAATFVSLMVWNVLLGFYVYKRLKIYPSVFGALKLKRGDT